MFVEENRPDNNNNDVTEKEHTPSDSYDLTSSDDNKREDVNEVTAPDEIPEEQDYKWEEGEKAESSFEVSEKSVPNHGDGTFYSRNADGVPANGYEWDESKSENSDYTHMSENTDTPVPAVEQPKEPSKSKKESSGKGFRIFIAATLCVFTLSVVTLTAFVASFAFDDEKQNPASKLPSTNPSESKEEFDYSNITIDKPNFVAFDFKDHEGQVLSIPEIATKCTPSSVGIISEIETTYNYPFYFSPTTRIAEASGSGFIYSSDGYVITNHHVIENAVKITVVLFDGSEYEATLVGSDDLSDIAVLKINPDENVTLIPMEIGNSDELVVGEAVVAIGCPAGIEFIGTVTDGIISAINRNVELTDDYGSTEKTMTLIQTNATINHGNSGGPLINSRGQVIGINTLKLSADYEGIGFSIPISGASPIISQLIEHGKVVERTEEDFAYGKGMIGINGTEISDDESEYYGIPKGVLVVQIDRESSASAAGLRRGDIITHYNGTKVSTVDDINNLKGSARAGTQVTLTVYRDGEDGKGETFDIVFKLDAQN